MNISAGFNLFHICYVPFYVHYRCPEDCLFDMKPMVDKWFELLLFTYMQMFQMCQLWWFFRAYISCNTWKPLHTEESFSSYLNVPLLPVYWNFWWIGRTRMLCGTRGGRYRVSPHRWGGCTLMFHHKPAHNQPESKNHHFARELIMWPRYQFPS